MSTSPEAMSQYAWAQVQSAKTFALVGFIFFAILAAIWSFSLLFTVIGFAFVGGMTVGMWGAGVFFALIFPGIFLALSVGLAVWAWTTLKDIETGRYAEAQTPSLVLGILGLFPPIGGLIGGIFFLLAYSKLGNAIAFAQAPPPAIVPPQVAPVGRICPDCGRPIAMDAKFCSHCGKELP